MAAAGRRLELPPDNASRLAIFDAFHDLAEAGGTTEVRERDLIEQVLPRLRVLVPRELHLFGEQAYVEDKLRACIDEGMIRAHGRGTDRSLSLTGMTPRIRYPDGELRDYSPGLEPARERLDADNARLRAADFDVQRFVPSVVNDPDGPHFQALLASMREHGFLKQFPLLRHDDGTVVDGRARIRAAEILGLDVEDLKYGSVERDRSAARRRDTPLNRVLLALHCNAARLGDETLEEVHEQVSKVTGRPWAATQADLVVTQLWRRAVPSDYSPRLEVRRLPYRDGVEAKIQVTDDDKVMLRSLLEAAGLAGYKIKLLEDYVPFERARSNFSGGRKAVFARAEDLIAGIATMQAERAERKLKLDPEWDHMLAWLRTNFGVATPEPREETMQTMPVSGAP
jgi:hypothetical protein